MTADPTRLLFGPCPTPAVRSGDVVFCDVRGEGIVYGLTDARIPWPVGRRGRARTYVVFAGLADAVRREAAAAVGHWWGAADGHDVAQGPRRPAAQRRDAAAPAGVVRGSVHARGPGAGARQRRHARRERQEAAAKRGKPRPPAVRAAIGRAQRGRTLSPETRAKMSAAHRRRLGREGGLIAPDRRPSA
jgi:hypothetical protein